MITNEAEIRVALQAVLISVLALYGFWGCALVVLVILLPWKPLLAVGGYLAQPIVDWRLRKARERHEKGMAQIEQELDTLLKPQKSGTQVPAPAPVAKPADPAKPPQIPHPRPLESLPAMPWAGVDFQEMMKSAESITATLAIPSAIKSHVQNLPQGAFNNMNLEVERVDFRGDTAEAYVKFRSPSVRELVIPQRYLLRKSGEHWLVESRQPGNGAGHVPPSSFPAVRPRMPLAY